MSSRGDCRRGSRSKEPVAHPRPHASSAAPQSLRIGAAAADLLRVPAAAAAQAGAVPRPNRSPTRSRRRCWRWHRAGGRADRGAVAVTGSGRRGRRDAMRYSARSATHPLIRARPPARHRSRSGLAPPANCSASRGPPRTGPAPSRARTGADAETAAVLARGPRPD
jgi:hypothetical protein